MDLDLPPAAKSDLLTVHAVNDRRLNQIRSYRISLDTDASTRGGTVRTVQQCPKTLSHVSCVTESGTEPVRGTCSGEFDMSCGQSCPSIL